MRIFLSARHGRRLELCGYREELVAMGYTVTSRWLDGPELELSSGKLGQSFIDAIEDGTLSQCDLRAELAQIDIQDIMAANVFVSFTEPPDSDASRGGRHVELGLAHGLVHDSATRIVVVGYRENIFHWLPEIEFAETWEKAKDLLR